MKKLFLGLAMSASCLSASASDGAGPVGSYLVSRYGKLFFENGVPANRPACSVNGHWAVDLIGTDGTAGKAILAVILSAKMSGKTVHVYGKGVCDVWGDRETVEYVTVD